MNKILRILIVLLLVTFNLPLATKVCAEDSDEEVVIRTGKRNFIHVLSDLEEDDDVSAYPNVQPSRLKYKETQDAIMNAVKSGLYRSRQEIAEALGFEFATVRRCIENLRCSGFLSLEELKSINLVEQRKFRHEVVELIRQKKTVEEILEFCKQHKDFSYREKTDNYLSRRYFLSMLEGFYQRGDLTINDTVYLKLEGTVVGRRGETKSKITEFLERRFRGLPTATRAELAREFNDFTWARYNMRGIQSTTFVEHVNQLIKKGKLSMQQVEFFNSCKEEKQQGGYVSISKRAKRK